MRGMRAGTARVPIRYLPRGEMKQTRAVTHRAALSAELPSHCQQFRRFPAVRFATSRTRYTYVRRNVAKDTHSLWSLCIRPVYGDCCVVRWRCARRLVSVGCVT